MIIKIIKVKTKFFPHFAFCLPVSLFAFLLCFFYSINIEISFCESTSLKTYYISQIKCNINQRLSFFCHRLYESESNKRDKLTMKKNVERNRRIYTHT